MSGAITGKTGVYNLSNVRFYNYPTGSVLFRTGRFCDDKLKYTNLGTEVYMEQITFTNVTGKMLFFIGALKRDVIYDTDGSLSQKFDGTSRASGTIVQGFPHIATTNTADCPSPSSVSTPADWDNAVMCGPAITIRRVMFGQLLNKQLFHNQFIKAVELSNINNTVASDLAPGLFTSAENNIDFNMPPKKEMKYVWGLPFITGRTYQIWWGAGLDFSHLTMHTTPIFDAVDDGIIFKFNYTENREMFEIGSMSGGVKQLTALDYEINSETQLDPTTCDNGQYFHDNQNGSLRMMTMCQSGKNRTKWENTDINGIICKYLCPAPVG